ncbi:MAG: pyruvate, phosphate dikinase [Candidatus Aegiribacteria sp. MLS_C]|nr:MAG: pyruvate, phosphate dikinase [Candidatus Aegiribacteria sp. MLS_C]
MNKTKYVFFFGGDRTEGDRSQKELLGGKGANLAEMTRLGLPVPPGFTISTQACAAYYSEGIRGAWPEGLEEEVREKLALLEEITGKEFGKGEDPLLVSVRSGAAVSMPGMMDTVLNLGMNRKSIESLISRTGNPRFVWDAYRRFIQMFGDVVMGIPHHSFEEALEVIKSRRGLELDTELTTEDLKAVVESFREIYDREIGEHFPEEPWEQLKLSIDAVFGSWNNNRAIRYREINGITGLFGTAVNVQTMVFGNMGDSSGTGVCFTRDPASGENEFYGEYLMNAQGEDVVAGIRTPKPISTLRDVNEKAYSELLAIRSRLEEHYLDMQDVEFTIQDGKLYILQTRAGKRTVFAALNIAVDMVREGLIDEKTALMRVPTGSFNQLFAPVLGRESKKQAQYLTTGLSASPGGACGRAVFSADDAEEWAARNENVILCRKETSPEDIGGMSVAKGIITSRGGMTSHAAVVARGMGTPCVAGASDLSVDSTAKRIKCGDVLIREGDVIALDGFTGEVFAGEVKVKPSEILTISSGEGEPADSRLYMNYSQLMEWADKYRRLGVRTNAETVRDTTVAVNFGAQGIGLCRTEHMFFGEDRIVSFRKLILVADEVKKLREQIDARDGDTSDLEEQLADPLEDYNEALNELLPLQKGDFAGIFRVLDGRPCTIRLLDPPLHEFLPHDDAGQREMAENMGVPVEKIRRTVEKLHEFNPMLGHRGCRLGLTYPEVSDMQVLAIMEAAIEVKAGGKEVRPEIMIPLVGHPEELRIARERAQKVIDDLLKKEGLPADHIDYRIGTMIEIPRAVMDAARIAEYADFFSFGTNDLTQMACGFSRDDAGAFLDDYVRMGIYDVDPFTTIDVSGVGRFVEMGVREGRKTRPDLKIGVCGEHGGDPGSIRFFNGAGLDYVSCSPFRVPVARLAAAQAIIEGES